MKHKILGGLVIAGLLMCGPALSLLAKNGPGQGGSGNGKGYGGPPQSQEERAARQDACIKNNGGVCPNGGPQSNCQAGGKGKGKGKGGRHGACDGTGPRNGGGSCPNPSGQGQK